MEQELAERFVLVRLDPKADREVAHRFSILWTPTLVFLHPRGARLRETVGYLPPGELMGELRLAQGHFAMRSARHAEAAELFARVAAEQPTSAPEALFWLGTTHFFRGDKAGMWQAWRDLAQRYPESTWAHRTTLTPEG